MNERIFRLHVYAVISVFALLLTSGVVLKVKFPEKDDPIYATFKDLLPLIIAIPAAWLGYCFQRRQAYLKDVKDCWTKIVASVQKAIQYTHLESPAQASFASVNESLSCAIEELRAIFKNLATSKNGIGLYPFEGLKEIQDEISKLGFGSNVTSEGARLTRFEIISRWKRLRDCYLVELSRGIPTKPDSRFLKPNMANK